MRMKVFAAFLFALSVTVCAGALTGWGMQGAAPQEGEDQTSLKARVKKVKAQGQNKVEFDSPVPIYAETSGLGEASSTNLVVIASPLEATTLQLSPDKLTTFQKFQIREKLAAPTSMAEGCCGPSASDLPPGLAAPGAGQIYVRINGGRAVIDEVEVTQRPELKFKDSEEYLLFLMPDESGSIGTVPLGPYGVFRLKGDEVESVLNYPHTLDAELKSKYGKSLSRLKDGLKGKPAKR